jgi:DNA-binding CsgD family transcriptional regulator
MAKSSSRVVRNWFSEMQRLFHSAQYGRAAELYDRVVDGGEAVDNDAILLRARLYLKTDNKRVVPFLLRHELHRPTKAQSARRAMYLGTGYSRLGEFVEADGYFKQAGEFFREGAGFGELAAHITRRYLDQRDIENAEKWQKETQHDRTLQGKIRSEHIATYIDARREEYDQQASRLIRVLDLIGDRRADFVEDWYAAVHTLAGLARELPLPLAAARARAEVDIDIEWSAEFTVSRFQALKAVAWCQALAGDELNCFRYLRLAQPLDVRPVWRAILFLDRSYFANIVGEAKWAANEFFAAADIVDQIEWEHYGGEERIALLLMAELATLHAPKRAPFYIAQFKNLGKLRSNVHHLAFDERVRAMEAYATGVVRANSGDLESAQEQLRVAWKIFDRIGYDVRGALTAQALFRATKASRWLHRAEDKLENYPRSWLARDVAKLSSIEERPAVLLSKMQRVVMQLVCEGLSTDEMADRLGLSRNTVLNHLKIVYKKIGVKSREALVVEAIRRGMIGSAVEGDPAAEVTLAHK